MFSSFISKSSSLSLTASLSLLMFLFASSISNSFSLIYSFNYFLSFFNLVISPSYFSCNFSEDFRYFSSYSLQFYQTLVILSISSFNSLYVWFPEFILSCKTAFSAFSYIISPSCLFISDSSFFVWASVYASIVSFFLTSYYSFFIAGLCVFFISLLFSSTYPWSFIMFYYFFNSLLWSYF